MKDEKWYFLGQLDATSQVTLGWSTLVFSCVQEAPFVYIFIWFKLLTPLKLDEVKVLGFPLETSGNCLTVS